MTVEQAPQMPDDIAVDYKRWQEAIAAAVLRDERNLRPNVISTDAYLREVRKKEAAEQIALIDPKTGLPNGLAFQQTLERCNKSHASGALIMMDLNGLKIANDEMGGHAVGDHLLVTIAKELQLNTAESDFVARVNDKGGDEFAVWLPGLSKERLPDVIERLQKIFSGGFDENDHLIPTVSIGAVHTDDIGDADRSCLRDCADFAMYKAKEQAKAAPSIIEHNVHLDRKYELRKPTASYIYNPQVDGTVLTIKDALASFQAQPQVRLK